MNILRSRPARLATLSLGLAATVGSALSQPASAASCDFVLESVQAVRLQEGGGDEIYLVLDGVRFPFTKNFVDFPSNGVTRSATSFEFDVPLEFDDQMKVKVFEFDPTIFVPDQKIGPTKVVNCTGNQQDQVLVFEDGPIEYRLTYSLGVG